ncbi:MAG: hypothetical protein ACM32O_08140, partial [Clostridia bacterium]
MTYKQILQIMWILSVAVSSFFCMGKGIAATEGQRQAIVLFIDGLSFADVDNLYAHPQLRRSLDSAAIGAMSIRTPGARTVENAYLQLGSGSQAVYSPRSDSGYMADELLASGETAAERMSRVKGTTAAGQNVPAVLFPGIHRLRKENQGKPYTERIGLLGSMLGGQGVKVALFGNGDYGMVRHRPAALFAMNREGEIPTGDVSAALLQKSSDDPFGVKTDYAKLAALLTGPRTGQELMVVELADLARLYRMREEMSEERFAMQHERVMAELATFLAKIAERRVPNQLLLVLSSSVNPAAQQDKSYLHPVFLWQGKEKAGWLTSHTTRQGGLVSGLDVLPTIAAWFHLPIPADLAGHVMKRDGVGGAATATVEQLLEKVSWIDHIYRNRPMVLSGYVMIQIFVLLVSLICWFWQRRNQASNLDGSNRLARLLLVSMLLYPGLFLLEPLLPWRVNAVMVLGLLVVLSLAAAALLERQKVLSSPAAAAFFSAGCILIGGFYGNEMISRSYMGYDPVIGARFYGLGNELEGVLIGASILVAAWVREATRSESRLTRRAGGLLVICWFALVLIYMGLPSLGANAGGFLAGAIGFGIALMRFYSVDIKKRGFLI